MRTAILAALAVLTLFASVTGGVAAHGSDETDASHDDVPEKSTDGWAAWMEQRMAERMGEERAEQMERRMPMTYEEMGRHMASHDHGSDDDTMGGMSGMGCH